MATEEKYISTIRGISDSILMSEYDEALALAESLFHLSDGESPPGTDAEKRPL
jgi:hypothetical protein